MIIIQGSTFDRATTDWATTSASTHAGDTARGDTRGLVRVGLAARTQAVVDQQRIQGERVRQQDVAHGRPAHGQGLQLGWVATAHVEYNHLEMDVHAVVDADDRAMGRGAVFELDRDGLAAQLDEKLNQLHHSVGSRVDPVLWLDSSFWVNMKN